jgi:hypothetical protein
MTLLHHITDRTGKREFRKKTFFFSPNLHKISKLSKISYRFQNFHEISKKF